MIGAEVLDAEVPPFPSIVRQCVAAPGECDRINILKASLFATALSVLAIVCSSSCDHALQHQVASKPCESRWQANGPLTLQYESQVADCVPEPLLQCSVSSSSMSVQRMAACRSLSRCMDVRATSLMLSAPAQHHTFDICMQLIQHATLFSRCACLHSGTWTVSDSAPRHDLILHSAQASSSRLKTPLCEERKGERAPRWK